MTPAIDDTASLARASRLAAFTELLAQSEATWDELITQLVYWPVDQRPEQGIALLEAVADRWLPWTRSLSNSALRQLGEGMVRPYLRLVRNIDLRPLWEVQRRDHLFARMIAEGGVRELHAFTTRYDHGKPIVEQLTTHVTGLRYLYLGGSGVESVGACMIAQAESLAGLDHLSLHNNAIEDDGALALLESPYLGKLGFLNLYGNRLSNSMIEQIHAHPRARQTVILSNDPEW